MTGESSYSADDLSQAIRTIKARIGETEEKLKGFRAEEEQRRQGIDEITPAYKRFRPWAEEFDKATLEQQKMVASHLFTRIEIGIAYRMGVDLL